MPVLNEDGSVALDHEEFPRPETTREGLASLKASFEAMANVPMDKEGTTLAGLMKHHDVTPEEFLDEVEVTDDDVIGEINRGWAVTQTMLVYERGAGETATPTEPRPRPTPWPSRCACPAARCCPTACARRR